jgi:hypothetical protein
VVFPLIAALILAGPAASKAAEKQTVSFDLHGVEFLGDGPDFVTLGAGAYNVIPDDSPQVVENDDVSGEVRLEYRLGEKLFFVGPMAGIMINTDGGLFGYGGIYGDIRAGHWVLTPAFGVGGYSRGDSKDLGGVFEFHLGLDISHEFKGGSRLGVKLAHISNAGTHEINPGADSVLLTYTLPLDWDGAL